MNISVEKSLERVKVVNENKRYWFVRTYGGEAFDHYIKEGYVGLGLNNVPLDYLKNAQKDPSSYNSLQSFISNNTKYKKASATKWANQLISFYHEISIGDTIIIPSVGSDKLAIGTVTSNVYLKADPGMIKVDRKPQELPEKRRNIKWEDTVYKDTLQGDLRNLTSTHQGMTNADIYSETIEGLLNSVFIKDDYMYLVIQIEQDEEINAFDFTRFLDGLTYFYQEFCKANGYEANEDLIIKIRMQSKGKALLKALVKVGIIGLAGLVILSNNMKVKVEVGGNKIEAESDGLLKSITDFVNEKDERKKRWVIFSDSMENLKIKRKEQSDLANDTTDSSVTSRK